jgi:hypothetical protein
LNPFDPDIDELIFALKNKDYGAYILRKGYNKTLFYSMWVVIIIFTAVTIAPLLYLIYSQEQDMLPPKRRVVQTIELSEPPSIDVNKKINPEEAPAPPVTSAKLTAPVIKSDDMVAADAEWVVDTVGLQNIYSENTLDVQIKYPYGWTFIDQNVKNRLDGVTFWGSPNTYNPPPYIHLEVVDKSLFDPRRFKYSREFNNYTIYYNEPQEMSNQFSRLVYIRTETDVDYTLKLIMKGSEQFADFEPVFFGMLQSFSFGN